MGTLRKENQEIKWVVTFLKTSSIDIQKAVYHYYSKFNHKCCLCEIQIMFQTKISIYFHMANLTSARRVFSNFNPISVLNGKNPIKLVTSWRV